uniref:Norcoclaurine 6-O-methyltransferase n=1 Tax=Sinopodophyllum hexandrum TaxID=93608 RepID=A0A0B4VG62_SINHE|nr:norcoclaurine 6-O-methyltransferase [Sinopodophyllum hexandrum]
MEAQKENISSQAKLWNFIYGFAESLVLKCAVELDFANIIHNHGKPMTLSELASQLPVMQPVNTNSLYRVMRYLVHINIFTKTLDENDGETKYGLAAPAKFLVKGWDNCMVGSILGITDKVFMEPWYYIKDELAPGTGTAFELALGKDIWEYMGENPEKNKLFNAAMACDTSMIMSALISECKDKFNGIRTLVDVGGGTGTAARNIARAFPNIKCTVYDLPHVIADSPVYPEINRVSGDMFKCIPNADAILMKCILHDWEDKECIEILKRCKEAVPVDGGKVIIIDVVLDGESEHPYTKVRLNSDLDMMLNTEGKERTKEGWKKLFKAAGYRDYNITQISALQSVIEAFPY